MDGDLVLFYPQNPAPLAALVVHNLAQSKLGKRFKIAPKNDAVSLTLMKTQEKLQGNHTIARFLARVHDASVPDVKLYGSNPLATTQIDVLVDTSSELANPEARAKLLPEFNKHLQPRSFFVEYSASLADIAIWGALKAANVAFPVDGLDALNRWYAESDAVFSKCVPQRAGAAAHAAPAKAKAGSDEKKEENLKHQKQEKKEQGGSFDIDLPGAAPGKVVTRFPPEPSGYLHIGHAKAALLNDHFARAFEGKLILRFDDTNPSKEKDEYVDNIMKDLATLGVKHHVLTHTSDHFETIIKYGRQLLSEGKGYVDDTPVEQMRKERMDGIESKHRNSSPEVNLKLFEEMLNATETGMKCCVRGKMDMQAKNKALRDPVFFRCNLTPHHRTGTKYKCYPTYDFACPIVDSIEGVTHALRTTEYHDRNDQYYWVIEALGLRKVHIWDFSRLNFKYTLMSKRKLQWFVDTKRVEGWYDPRFPTVQGIVRRGLTIDALREFIRLQGASKSIALMEWDKIWSINKRIIDPTAHRYNAVAKENAVLVTLSNVKPNKQGVIEEKEVALHPKDASLGTKKVAFTQKFLIEQGDAAEMKEKEEVTLMGWGNAIITKIERNGNVVTAITADLHLEGNVKTTDKKVTWVPYLPEQLVPLNMVEFDSLITKEKIEEDDDFESFVRDPSKFETALIGEPALRSLKQGQTLQLQRRGFFRCDSLAANDKPTQLFLIPDGREKTMSVLSSNIGKEMRDSNKAEKGQKAAKADKPAKTK